MTDPFCGDQHPMTYGYVAAVTAMAVDTMSESGVAKLPASLPILLLTGEADPASNMAANVRALEKLLRRGGLDVEAHYYPGARHEVLNETNRDEVHADFLAWIERISILPRSSPE
jgi:alpha-beta hydrolase superfamily lysophospholipase